MLFFPVSAAPSIVEPRNSRNHVPKLQAKFGVPEEEPDGPLQRLVDSVNTNAAVYNAAVSMILNEIEISGVAI